MDLQTLRLFFMWCTIINAAFLTLWFTFLSLAGDWVYRMHTKWFAMPRETWTVTIYALLGAFKVLVIGFNLVPWIALAILG